MDNNSYLAALQFKIKGKIRKVIPYGDGHIHESFFVKTDGKESCDYLLQKKNQYVFRNVPAMMDNIDRVTRFLKLKISENGGNPDRETLTLVKTKEDKLYYKDPSGEHWAMCVFINDSYTYQKPDSPRIAAAGGKVIGRFQSMLSGFDEPLTDILPGYHNMKYRFKQWDQALEEDIAGRKNKVSDKLAWIEERRKSMLKFWDLIEQGILPLRVAHNDTKISNILFDKYQQAICVIDLDTVMRSTVLNDFGDSIRTYTNTGDEDEAEVGKVAMDLEFFRTYSKGYLSEARSFLSGTELENLAFSAQYITFEQALRFLMDYINGDKYYKIHSPDQNLIRTRAQCKLLESMEDQNEAMKEIIHEFSR